MDYEVDFHAWCREQAALLRVRRFERLDVDHLAEELEAVARQECRELADRLAALLAEMLLRMHATPSEGGDARIRAERAGLRYLLRVSPSVWLRTAEPEWVEVVWCRALALASAGTDVARLPTQCPWPLPALLDDTWLP